MSASSPAATLLKGKRADLDPSEFGYNDEKIEDTLAIISEILEESALRDSKIKVEVFPDVLREAEKEIRRLRVRLLEAEATVATQQAMLRSYKN